MRRGAGLNRYSKAFAFAATLMLGAGVALAQEALAGAPPLTIRPGTFLTVRINDAISSNHNQVGDIFSAQLTQPVIVKGIVVAQRGQTVAGRVIDVQKAGKVSGVSRLDIALTNLTLVDGQNVPIQSQLLVRNGQPATERDAAALVGTTGAGAFIGGVAGGGKGAGIGAGVGAAVGTIGVLLTRGYSTVIYPESQLTFQITSPVAIYTDNAPQAFRAVNAEDYAQVQAPRPQYQQAVPQPAPFVIPPPVVVPPPLVYQYPYPYYIIYGSPYPYAYPYYGRPYFYGGPYFYGPSISLRFGYPGYYRYPAYRHGHYGRSVPYRGYGGGHGGGHGHR